MQKRDLEIELLLSLLNLNDSHEARLKAAELIRQRVDWQRLLELSLDQRVLPIVYIALNKEFGGEVRAGELTKFRKYYESNAIRNAYLTGELCRLLKLLESAGIEAIPYKGPALASQVLGDFRLEQFADLDVLIHKEDFKRVSQILVNEGYDPHFKLRESDENAFLRLSYVQLFRRESDKTVVELHWQVAPRFFIRPLLDDAFWYRHVKVSLAGNSVLSPSPEDLLVLLSVHGAKDLWDRLKWIYGFSEFVKTNAKLDWERALEASQRSGARRMVLLALRLAHDLMNTPLSPAVSQQILEDPAVEALSEDIQATLFDDPPTLRQRISFHLRTFERKRDRVRYCLLFAVTTTPVDWAMLPLPRTLSFIHYAIRPIRLLWKYIVKPTGARATPANP